MKKNRLSDHRGKDGATPLGRRKRATCFLKKDILPYRSTISIIKTETGFRNPCKAKHLLTQEMVQSPQRTNPQGWSRHRLAL